MHKFRVAQPPLRLARECQHRAAFWCHILVNIRLSSK